MLHKRNLGTPTESTLFSVDDIKNTLLDGKILDVLIPLTASDSVEVQGNAAAAIGNLSAKADDYARFNDAWSEPDGGLQGYLTRFMASPDRTFQHIAVWTIVQFLEGNDEGLKESVRKSEGLKSLVNTLIAAGEEESAAKEANPPQRQSGEVKIPEGNEVKPSDSVSQNGSIGSDDDYAENGEAEIPQLAKRIAELLEP